MNDKNCKECKHFNAEINLNHIVTLECPHKGDKNIRFRKSQMEEFFEILANECKCYEHK
jgi:hypothetical protein